MAHGRNGIWLVPIMIPDMIGAVYMDIVYEDSVDDGRKSDLRC